MDRPICSHPDLFTFYYESMATIPAVPATTKSPRLLHALFYRSSKAALRRQVILLTETGGAEGAGSSGHVH